MAGTRFQSMWPAFPAIHSATAAPSSSALCASIGPATASPMAHIQRTSVRSCASTFTRPFASSATPAFSSPRPSRVRPAPDGDQDLLGGKFERLALALGEEDRLASVGPDAGNLRP